MLPLQMGQLTSRHFRKYPDEYKTAVAQLLQKASAAFSQRVQQMEGEKLASDGSNNRHLNQAGVGPNKEIRSASAHQADHFVMPSSSQCHEGNGMDSISIQDESQESLIQLPSSRSITWCSWRDPLRRLCGQGCSGLGTKAIEKALKSQSHKMHCTIKVIVSNFKGLLMPVYVQSYH